MNLLKTSLVAALSIGVFIGCNKDQDENCASREELTWQVDGISQNNYTALDEGITVNTVGGEKFNFSEDGSFEIALASTFNSTVLKLISPVGSDANDLSGTTFDNYIEAAVNSIDVRDLYDHELVVQETDGNQIFMDTDSHIHSGYMLLDIIRNDKGCRYYQWVISIVFQDQLDGSTYTNTVNATVEMPE